MYLMEVLVLPSPQLIVLVCFVGSTTVAGHAGSPAAGNTGGFCSSGECCMMVLFFFRAKQGLQLVLLLLCACICL